jgi:hypothetical protein
LKYFLSRMSAVKNCVAAFRHPLARLLTRQGDFGGGHGAGKQFHIDFGAFIPLRRRQKEPFMRAPT